MQPTDRQIIHLENRLGYASDFTPALLDPERAPPAIVSGPNGKSAGKRYNVYRNNVTVSLINALAATFPATQRITGVDFFRAMARFHIRATPPTSPLLFDYGHGFPDFIERYEYARAMPWLADVARIERAWLDAYHAADAKPLTPTGPGFNSSRATGRNCYDATSLPRELCARVFRQSVYSWQTGKTVQSAELRRPDPRMRW